MQQNNNPVSVDNTNNPMNPMASIPMNPLPPAEGTQQFCLRWNSYPATVATQLAALRQSEDFVDVTLACDGRQLLAHKLVLSACSPYFMQLFKSTPCQHPVIFLRDVGFRQLVALLEFMYAGEVNVSQLELPALLRTAEALQVRGLADTTANNNIPPPPQLPQIQRQSFSPQYTQAQPQPQTMLQPQPQQQQQSGTQLAVSSEQPVETPVLPNQPSEEPEGSTPKGCTKEDEPLTVDDQNMNADLDEEDTSSESNDDSQDDFEVTESDMKEFINHTPATDGQIPDPGDLFGGSQDASEGTPMDLNQADIGNVSLTGSQSEEESSEEDDDDGECKEFTYQSDASYSQETMPEPGAVTENGESESIAGPSGTATPAAAAKEEGSVLPSGTGSGRSRLSRSLWPPGIPYHGPQQCPYCPRVLSNVGNWRKHVLTMHFAREKVYKCRHCNSAFRTAEYLQKHYVRVHNYPQKMTRRKYVEQT